ncbi:MULTISPECIES: hypothetical protein [unclassified Bradyrhizobium]|uniref:hypothetical protein n=1 Tax=unclassified Bradyrhizobium TaxID=2631580 RepID=UPI001FF93CC2
MNFQATLLKILVSYPEGFAVMEDLKRDMAILATSGREWADRTKRLAARVPDLDIFSHGLVRISGGWKITANGRAVLDFMEARHAVPFYVSPTLESAKAASKPTTTSTPASFCSPSTASGTMVFTTIVRRAPAATALTVATT